MHSISEFGANVPAFLAKLWKMVEDPSTNDLILWSPSGTSFLIRDQARFCKELLPMYYKHNNMASFIRQLNMYGFHKIVSVEAGSAKLEQDENEFHHPCFIRDHPYMLEHIKRKITGSKIEGVNGRTDMVNKVLTDVRQMRNRQETMDSRLSQMKLENEALWRELAILRQKHLKQQQIVNKLIQFLVSLVQHPHHNNGISVKRRNMPLMLQDKVTKRDSTKSDQKSFAKSPSGPVIHELDPTECATALLDTVEDLSSTQSEQFITVEQPIEESESALDSFNKKLKSTGSDGSEEEISADRFLIDAAAEILPSVEVESLLHTASAPAVSVKQNKFVSKRGRPKKVISKCSKKVISEIKNKQPSTSEINDIILPVITRTSFGGSSFPIVIDTVTDTTTLPAVTTTIDSSQNLDHVTPDTFKGPVECDTTVNLDDLAEICPGTNLIQRQVTENSSHDVPVLLGNQPTDVINNPSITKIVNNKRFNIGKNASTLFKNKKGKLPSLAEKKEKFPSLTEKKVSSNGLDKEKSSSLPVINSEDCNKLESVQENEVTKKDDDEDSNSSNNNNNEDMTVVCTTGLNAGPLDRADMDIQVDTMQNELESLKELLKYENLSLDANALLGLFNTDDPMQYNLDVPLSETSSKETKENNSNKITMYTAPTTVLDLNDVFNGNDWSLPGTPDTFDSNYLNEDIFSEVNTPNVSISRPSYSPPAKKKRK
ncbi:heat shock factor isoform X2 [Lycorma delicatula]|uniref:heat shock factor isoform X2 n=1 Tax=Lycorma delicatula TaxID=130591 RepID=UPI003F5147AA